MIRDIIISEGISMKRYHFAGRGRMRPYKRRTSHIRVILSDGKAKEVAKVVERKEEKVEAKAEKKVKKEVKK